MRRSFRVVCSIVLAFNIVLTLWYIGGLQFVETTISGLQFVPHRAPDVVGGSDKLESNNGLILESSAPDSLKGSTATATPAATTSIAAQPEKMVVMATIKGDNTDWVREDLPDWQNSIYHADDPTAPLHTTYNKGRESMAYLTYIIENYHNLASTIAFVHSHKDGYPKAWHTDNAQYSNVVSLQQLNIPFVQENGYVNLRCTWIPGCPDEIQPFRQEAHRESEHHFQDAWLYMFNSTDVPEQIGAACCAQFAVSREQVLSRPLEDYIRFRQWVIDTELDDSVSGRVMEYLWHIIFGKPAVYCPNVYECQCNVYGDQSACEMARKGAI